MNSKKKKNIDLSSIEYLEKDRLALRNITERFLSSRTVPQNMTLPKKHLAGLARDIDYKADIFLKMSEGKVNSAFSYNVNRLIYRFHTAKSKFPLSPHLKPETYSKLKKLNELALIIESGKVYKKRLLLKEPEYADIRPFLRKRDIFARYFNEGAAPLVRLEDYAYTLDKMSDSFKAVYADERVRRGKRRVFYIHVGKTNSGKTYTSLQKLKAAKRGVYLSPLRLLALEVSDTLNSEGIPCSLITGEEEHIVENASHTASTVELANFRSEYNVAVIDECQMIADPIRGHAWTKAIMNIRADEICLCTAPEALDILTGLIDGCGDYYTIVHHRRKTPLVVEDKPFKIDDVQNGDALVAFSKAKVNAIGAQLIKKGISVSVLYGALPYKARKQQFENFITGRSSVLVTTDAIGMGVNLPVRRIVFMEAYKFDGRESRPLNSSEIKQIAGRAGRRGKFDIGFVTACGKKELEYIRKGLNAKTQNVKGICVNFPRRILEDENISLKNALAAWARFDVPRPYIKESLQEASDIVDIILNIYNKLKAEKNKTDIFDMAVMPVDLKDPNIKALWLDYVRQRLGGAQELKKPPVRLSRVDDCLSFSKMLDAYYMCSRSWDMSIDHAWLEEQRRKCNEALINGLIDNVESYARRCKLCGRLLEWNEKGDYCDVCREYAVNLK